MNIIEIILLSIAISIDSFAASTLIGVNELFINYKKGLLVAIIFATFQSVMPLIGYVLADIFSNLLSSIDHIIAFVILLYLGINMINNKTNEEYKIFNIKSIIVLAIAVTIDAFTIGITYNVLKIHLLIPFISNYIVTFISSLIGIVIGHFIGNIIGDKTNIIGGITLILIGLKILLNHLNII